MSRSNETASDLLAGSLREAITKRRSVIEKYFPVTITKNSLTFHLLSAEYIELTSYLFVHALMVGNYIDLERGTLTVEQALIREHGE